MFNLLKYYELVFFQLQLLKTLCKFIVILLSYERKKGAFFIETSMPPKPQS